MVIGKIYSGLLRLISGKSLEDMAATSLKSPEMPGAFKLEPYLEVDMPKAEAIDYSKLNIEKEVPIPPKKVGRPKGASTVKTLVKNLRVGDSVLVDTRNQYQYIRKTMEEFGFAHTSRAEDGKVRIWRTKK